MKLRPHPSSTMWLEFFFVTYTFTIQLGVLLFGQSPPSLYFRNGERQKDIELTNSRFIRRFAGLSLKSAYCQTGERQPTNCSTFEPLLCGLFEYVLLFIERILNTLRKQVNSFIVFENSKFVKKIDETIIKQLIMRRQLIVSYKIYVY